MKMDNPGLWQTIYAPANADPGAHTEERQLWLRVLHMALHDALSLKDEALSWVGTWPSRDFYEVCRLAGVDGDWLWHRLRGLIDGPASERKAALKAMGVFTPEGALRKRSERISATNLSRRVMPPQDANKARALRKEEEGKAGWLPAETHP